MSNVVPPPTLSRRKFLRGAAIGAGAAALTCCGLGYAAARSQPKTPPVPVDTPSYTYGEGIRNRPVLVAYATRAGSTTGVASAIGETLAARGFRVDVRPVKENPALKDYQAVIIGSAINGYHWLPEAVEYVSNNQQALNQMPVALFCVHLLNLGESERSRKNRRSYLDEIRPLLPAAQEAYFAGKGADPQETAFILRWIEKTFMDGGEGDCRDWEKIRAWAQQFPL